MTCKMYVQCSQTDIQLYFAAVENIILSTPQFLKDIALLSEYAHNIPKEGSRENEIVNLTINRKYNL